MNKKTYILIALGFLSVLFVIGFQNCAKKAQQEPFTQTSVNPPPTNSTPNKYKTTPTAFADMGNSPTATIQNPGCRTPQGGRDCVATIAGRLTYNSQAVTNAALTICAKQLSEPSYVTGGCVVVYTDNDGNILSNSSSGPWAAPYCLAPGQTSLDTALFMNDVKGSGPSTSISAAPVIERKNVPVCPP